MSGIRESISALNDRPNKKVWIEKFTPEQYEVCRMKGTELPFTGKYYWDCKEDGVYRCICCGNELFDLKQSLILAPAGQISGLLLRYRTWNLN